MANTLTFANRTLTDENIFGGLRFLADLNTGDEFSIGNTASASVEFVTDVQLPLYTKDAVNGKFTWTQDSVARGRYYITEVKKETGRYTVTAYDAMSLLEKNISELSLTFPLTVSAAASAIATYIGCTVSGTITNGTLSVSALDEDMTIRDLLAYVAEASGCSVKIDSSDHLCFMYYADSGITITDLQYKEFGLNVADYTCAAIDKVAILNSVGATKATAGSGSNALYIEANPFLENADSTVAAAIYAKVNGFVYAPLTCEMFEEYGIQIGTIVTFGSTPTLVMHLESSEEGAIASSVGSDSRAEYNKSFETMLAALTEEALGAADDASKVATKYVTAIDQNGIRVHAESSDSINYAKIDANGMDIVKGGESVAMYGNTARVGKEDSQHILVSGSDVGFYDDDMREISISGVSVGSLKTGYIEFAPDDVGNGDCRVSGGYGRASNNDIISLEMNARAEGQNEAYVRVYSSTEGVSRVTVAPELRVSHGGNSYPVINREYICYANSRVDSFANGQITLSLASLGITTGAKPVGILLTYQDGGATPTILRYDYDASSANGVVIKAYDSNGNAVSGDIRYFAVVFQNTWTSAT